MKFLFQKAIVGGTWGIFSLGFALALETDSLGSSEKREIVRRKENVVAAQDLIHQSERAMRNREYENATQTYLQALHLISTAPAVAKLRQNVIHKFGTAALRYTQELIRKGHYSDAITTLETLLQYAPQNQTARRLLTQLQKPDLQNQGDFEKNREPIKRLLSEAKSLSTAGRLDLAHKRYEQILHLDPENIAARQGQEQLHRRKEKYYQQAALENRAHLLTGVTKNWERPVTPFQNERLQSLENSSAHDVVGTEEIRAKLSTIILPKVEFHGATIREAIDFLKWRAKELDPTLGAKGVNIVLKTDSKTTRGPSAIRDNAKIDLKLNHIPLYEALRYVCELANLKLKIEPYAVSIVPLSESTDQLLTQEYRISPNFLPTEPVTSAPNSTNDNKKPWVRIGAQEYLQSQGVPFPNGAFANYVAAGSRLIVRNTLDALNLIDSIVDAANGAASLQVQIEAKFINISQTNLKELGFDWLLGPFSLPSGLTLSGGAEPPIANAHYPAVDSHTHSPQGGYPVTGNLRHGSGTGPHAAISTNSLNALIAQTLGQTLSPRHTSSLFGISGIFTRPQFQLIIRALSQAKGVDLVSAPKVTARSGQKATIKMIRAFPYPTEFHPPQVPQKGRVTSNDVLTNNAFVSQTVTPATPMRFEVRNTGITMEVEPFIGPDRFTIDLNLSPEVVSFDGFVNYGVPILGVVNQAITGIPAATVLTENAIPQPIFSTRKVTTSVSVWDGQTVVLGGLMREDVQKVQDKIPFLGDIPLLGQLFRSHSEQKIKENLIIFVTARLVDAQGNPLHSEEADYTSAPL